jgi:hypothetical protein
MSKVLTTRSIATADAIRNREEFKTHGSLMGTTHKSGAGRLNREENDLFVNDWCDIDYVVYSYATPIAWHNSKTGWHIVNQKFSVTTTKHQGNLYNLN